MDVKTLDLNLSLLITDIGTDPGVAKGLPFSTVWRAIQYASKLANVGLDKIRTLEHNLKQVQESNHPNIVKDISDGKLEAAEANNKAGNALTIVLQVKSDSSILKNEFKTFQDFISEKIPKALNILMDGYNVGAGSTNRPCGFILDKISDVEQKTQTILENLNKNVTMTATTGSSSGTNSSWEGGFNTLFGAALGQRPPSEHPTNVSELDE